ncbi:metalloregulator ArsR/SmtB family transcription factor [soil metagenome]
MPDPDIDRLFHALGDPTRRAMLDLMSQAPRSVSRLAEPLGVTLTAIAQHLRVLEAAGLVRTQKVGRVRTCALDEAGFTRLDQWSAAHRPAWRGRLDRLGDLLDEADHEGS